jgi:hypothetical protein
MTRSDTIAKLLPALIKARSEMTKVVKDSTTPHFKSKYADLAGCLEACEPALGKYGLAVLQTTRWSEGVLTLDTVLAHDSGEWIASEYPVLCTYTRPQEIGAGLTYARRYSYLAITGRAPEDDDGETAMGRGHHANGHHTNQANGRNGNGKTNGHVAPVSAPVRPQTLPPQQSTAVAEPDASGIPVSGGSLGRWVTRIEREHGPGMLTHMLERARSIGLPRKWAQWTADQVEDAYRDAMDVMALIYDDDDGDGRQS